MNINDNHMEKTRFTLREIAKWVHSEDSLVKLPDLQRGLAWKARQTELLWDSILRGFPIGSFIMSDTADGRYYLMDGQQRYNAIAVGFGLTEDPGVRLWLDIRPPKVEKSTRQYWVKMTTTAHPWGFNNDDECTVLTSKHRRDALTAFGMKDRNIYKDRIELKDTWPFAAGQPIPLDLLLEASHTSKDSEGFADAVMEGYKKASSETNLQKLDENDKKRIADMYNVFKDLDDYTVQYDILPLRIIEKESSPEGKTQDESSLEILFNRLNTGGTRISQDDLNYSAVKAYWSGIKDTNDLIAARFMPPSKLVMLAFRLALTEADGSQGIANPPSIPRVRSIAKGNTAKDLDLKVRIEELYRRADPEDALSTKLGRIMTKVDSWLGVTCGEYAPTHLGGAPAFIRTSIARNSPEVYLLLMYFASRAISDGSLVSGEDARGLALLLHWFGRDKKAAVTMVFNHLKENGETDSIRKGLSACFGSELLIPVYSPYEMRQFFEIERDRDWSPWARKDYAPWHDFYTTVSWWGNSVAQEMLLYAQREYIDAQFKLYDPAREDMWEKHNRPWDYDHIVPQNWIKERGRTRATYRDYCDHWVGRIGNIGAIPFEDNRSKSDKVDYAVYLEHPDELLFNKDKFMDIACQGKNLPENEEYSFLFAQTVFDRTVNIYGRCYEAFGSLLGKTILTGRQERRKSTMLSIQKQISGAEIVYVAQGGVLWREYPVEKREVDWAREWMSVGVKRGNYFICLSWGCNERKDADDLEIGFRKLPGNDILADCDLPISIDSLTKYKNNDWWYAEKDIPVGTDEETIVRQLTNLIASYPQE